MAAKGMLGVLEALDVLTPERLERLKKQAAKTGAARVLRAVKEYDRVVQAYKRREAKPLELARAHGELLAALEQNGEEVRGVASLIVSVFRSALAPKR